MWVLMLVAVALLTRFVREGTDPRTAASLG